MALRRPPSRLGDVSAMLRVATGASNTTGAHPPINGDVSESVQRKRELVADFCRLIGSRLHQPVHVTLNPRVESKSDALPHLSPRMRQTLQALLDGDSEKQIARRLALSPHTVHVYVKALYKGFGVNSRGELLARFVRPPTSVPAFAPIAQST